MTISKITHYLLGKKANKVDNFSDYSASEKTKIIRKAARESNRMQKELSEKYSKHFAI